MSNTLTPFLYHTRTLQRIPTVLFTGPSVSRSLFHSPAKLQARKRRSSDESIPFELPPGLNLTSDESRGADSVGPGGESETVSTITPTERRAFDTIFQEIASRSNRPSRSHLADNVISLVVQDADRSSARSSSRRNAVVDRDDALEKFPPSLRKAASMALGALKEDDSMETDQSIHQQDVSTFPDDSVTSQSLGEGDLLDWDDDGLAIDKFVKTAAIGEHRQRERRRVENLMLSAESDFKLWETMSKDVFHMVERLGIGERGPLADKRSSGSKAQAAKRKKEELNIYVHGPLYPLLLLRGLRLLDRAFGRPSQLALSVLPRVQELGLASYVLGASTPFYNTLMSIYWYRYGDVSAVFDLLEEMRRAGLSFDEDSLDLLRDMETALVPYAEGEHGQFAKELTAMPEYEAAFDSRLPHWEKVIQSSIDDKKREALY
ncbi:hypothetical protein BR93DRAFT_930884 [Coniochaeta sp. PMI_546]|nr:hypothetical protein BR93DRAFT_930884 [Coniochaeta sp. PMI_546]